MIVLHVLSSDTRDTSIASLKSCVCIPIRWLLHWGSPLPIPNREVKPNSADGTAFVGEYVAAFFKPPSLL